MWTRCMTKLTVCTIISAYFYGNFVNAGPTIKLDRQERDVYPELETEGNSNKSQVCVVGDVLYKVNDRVPSEHPCLQCKCQPPGVQCETIMCKEKKIGCKTIHKPNECCPHFQCECQYNGKTYSNGERIKNMSGKECQACYCKGGEIQCTNLKCYIRKDCEGKQVAGQCCPTYDHCPLIGTADRVKSTHKTIPNLSLKNLTLLIVESPNIGSSNVQESLNNLVQKNAVENLPIKIIDISSVTEDKNKLCIDKTNFIKTQNEPQENVEYDVEFESANDLSTASSTHILSLVKFKNKPNPTTEASLSSSTSSNLQQDHEDFKISSSVIDPIEENPAYPAIPDIMTLVTDEPIEEESASSSTTNNLLKDTKLLPEILEIRNNNTIPKNGTHTEWLKINNNTLVNFQALLPSDIIAEFVESDSEINTEESETTTNQDEKWIPIEMQRFETLADIDMENDDVDKNISTDGNKSLSKIEIITEQNKENATLSQSMYNITEFNQTTNFSENVTSSKIVKRSVNSENEDDDIFRQLDKELELPGTQTQKTKEEEEIESRQIFGELYEEISTPKPKPQGKDAETIDKLTSALANMVFRKSTVDANIFSVLKDLFGSQYRAYNGAKSV